MDAMLERWQSHESIKEAGPYRLPEVRLHARVLVSRGRLAAARDLYQIDFERTQPSHRPYLLQRFAELGVPVTLTRRAVTRPARKLSHEGASMPSS
ncbi:hypothetical protein AB0J74_36910 [Asanoa sp. NPDC049573]|uniref:hypothetical protein n=1 Tax=Asanoa sp. NPDC049573 TaxID=3155396 RepID=UPI003436B298